MDKLTKILKKLSPKERIQLEAVLSALVSGKTVGLDIKKLKGVDDVYRARVGVLRVIFKKESGDLRILDLGRRDENTYRDFQ